jgi:hypothetical protein
VQEGYHLTDLITARHSLIGAMACWAETAAAGFRACRVVSGEPAACALVSK